MASYPVIRSCSYCLAHVPELIRYGSKPRREIIKNPDIEQKILDSVRSFSQAVCYPPNQTFVGNRSPENLAKIARPWYQVQGSPKEVEAKRVGTFGEIVDQEFFLALLREADVLTPPLFQTDPLSTEKLKNRLADHPLFGPESGETIRNSDTDQQAVAPEKSLPIYHQQTLYGYFHRDERAEGMDDENLAAHDLLENLCAKASGVLALKWLLHREGIGPEQVDFVISCGEEACGDRYQRGGGGMAKAIAEMCGCVNASGVDVKNFCAAPASALIMAGALVQAGIHDRIVVVGGGSLAKLGMKLDQFLDHQVPILEDCLGSMAFLVTRDDGVSPVLRLEPGAVGKVPIGSSTSEESVYRSYLLEPLMNLGLRLTDIDKYATELHNPEITEFSGSGDVVRKNYRKIAAMAVLSRSLEKQEMENWISEIGMVGFAPTQGHIPSAVPYIGHALEAMRKGELRRVMFLAKASVFLNRCTNLFDGVSFLLERNPQMRAEVS